MTEMNRPDAVVDFLEADGVLLQRLGDEEQTRRRSCMSPPAA
jgi:hypothetical protein